MTAKGFVRKTAATLAVGTEVTDGQILDRNSAWISAQVTDAGLDVVEHRAVADDHAAIEQALRELAMRVDVLFVTGGLGPTSDDFTRDLIAKVFARPLEFDSDSWRHLEALLSSRGVEVREVQKKQCYFPKGATVLSNPSGTANAFCFVHKASTDLARQVQLVVLPGPPVEIAAVWELNLRNQVEGWVSEQDREKLWLLRFIGRGESQVAEIVERILDEVTLASGTRFKVGYRAHVPYVEVKLWHRPSDRAQLDFALEKIEAELRPWLVNRNNEDVADVLIDWASAGKKIRVIDAATSGLLVERIAGRIAERKVKIKNGVLAIETSWSTDALPRVENQLPNSAFDCVLELKFDAAGTRWVVNSSQGSEVLTPVEILPVFKSKVDSDRGRKFIVEKLLLEIAEGRILS